MSEPTPGPWYVEQPSMGFSAIRGPNHELIFGLAAGGPEEKQPDDVCEANARLIAAAPDLLAALQKIANGDGVYGAQAHDYKQIARAAIARATGDES